MARDILVDRKEEVAALRRLAASGHKQLAILYGRRQVGKTYLLSHAWSETRVFYFLAASLTPDLNRLDLLRELAHWTGRTLDPADFPTWRTVFRELVALAKEEPLVVVLDEFQYLLGSGSGDATGDAVTSQLVTIWERAPRETPLLLVLSGSEVSTMAHLHGGGEPLYGRVTWSAQLRPFDYYDAAGMLPRLAHRDLAYAYGMLGGTPRYLAAVEEGEPLSDSVTRIFVSPHGEVHLQMLTLVEQEKGVRQPSDYRGVLSAVASGCTLLNGISMATGLEEHVVRRVLGVLSDLGLVAAARNFGASARAPYRYRILDRAVDFWHTFLVPARSQLVAEAPDAVWTTRIAPVLNTYMGRAFEEIVRQAFARHHDRWGLPAAQEWSRWEGQDRERQSIELDIVARLTNGAMLTGELKWSAVPRGAALHWGLVSGLSRLAASGQAWAHDAGAGEFLYVSAAGFTAEMYALAEAEPRIHLVTLDDLYAGLDEPGAS